MAGQFNPRDDPLPWSIPGALRYLLEEAAVTDRTQNGCWPKGLNAAATDAIHPEWKKAL